MRKLILGDCFDRLRNINEKSIELIICDPPYGQTACKWDKPFNKIIINEFRRILRDDGVLLIFGREPELSLYRIEGIDIYKYDFIWIKSRKNGYLQAKSRPLNQTESIAVFSRGATLLNAKNKMLYFPQFLRPFHKRKMTGKRQATFVSGASEQVVEQEYKDYPTNIIECDCVGRPKHPTEKPINLFEYLILTFTQIGDTVLDCCFGSGNSLIAAKTLNRNFIGIEQDQDYFNTAKSNI